MKSDVRSVIEFMRLDILETALQIRAIYWVQLVAELRDNQEKAGLKPDNEKHLQAIVKMSASHMQYLTFLISKETVEKTPIKDQNVKAVMLLLMRIYALK